MDTETVIENFEVDNQIVSIRQLSGSAFISACLECNSEINDNTGLRIHPGAAVACRFVLSMKPLFIKKHICEIGCGTGILGLIVAKYCNIGTICFTDGNISALDVCKTNIESIFGCNSSVFSFQHLLWENSSRQNLMKDRNNIRFDIVLGCELMYYRTDLEALTSTLEHIVDIQKGLFIHAHIFRVDGMEIQMINSFRNIGWNTLEVVITDFINENELKIHPEWYKARCLVSAKDTIIEELRRQHPTWIPFVPEQRNFIESTDDDMNDELSIFTAFQPPIEK